MDKLSVEVFQHICFFATATARSLALTSKRVSDASQPYRFHSVILLVATVGRLESLLAHLAASRVRFPDSPPQILDLFLLCTEVTSAGKDIRRIKDSRYRDYMIVDGRHNGPDADETPAEPGTDTAHYAAHLSSLFAQAGPSLETLSIVFMERNLSWNTALPTRLPHLRELTVVNASQTFVLGRRSAPPPRPPRLPALRRLYWFGAPEDWVYLASLDIARFGEHAPQLTHVRLSNFEGLASSPGAFNRPDGASPLSKVPIPPSLRNVRFPLLQMSPFMLRDATWIQTAHIEGIEDIWRALEHSSLPVCMIPAQRQDDALDHAGRDVQRLARERLARIRGGDGGIGCWEVREGWKRAKQRGDVPDYLVNRDLCERQSYSLSEPLW
ncbi:uncharacterized protein BXZ73DRAFT_105383 [Epithele typhae]|uniref:uncharacterized protein n=1 Tax=Epithele typhae TaxID=378194 RepID=UPI0020077E18|nr:uncharacterized protein BXZ73DRAFT_105383 [Epithele typhae]KAH9917861.1 hypothetical protein BXZ73DRAFT_105383 [Epithele typhae]